jgi:DNA-binding transcriptional LysR family regulator
MDKLETMRTFCMVATLGSFKAASERLGISTALCSKYVNRLEDRLGVRLLNRTTRSLALTELGEVYLERCKNLLEDFDELDASMHERTGTAKGLIKISAPRTYGEVYLSGLIGTFLKENPEVEIVMDLNDRYIDIVEEGFDIAIRIGDLDDSSFYAKKIDQTAMVVCATPSYFAEHNRPTHPEELSAFECVLDANKRQYNRWPFYIDGKAEQIEVNGRSRFNSATAVREALLHDAGVGFCPLFAVEKDIETGALERVLTDFESPPLDVHAVYPHNRHLALKVRLFVDFLAQNLRS